MVNRIKILAAWAMLQAAAMAQSYELPPPNVSTTERSLLWPWLYGLAFLIGCLVVAFKPAKRANLQ